MLVVSVCMQHICLDKCNGAQIVPKWTKNTAIAPLATEKLHTRVAKHNGKDIRKVLDHNSARILVGCLEKRHVTAREYTKSWVARKTRKTRRIQPARGQHSSAHAKSGTKCKYRLYFVWATPKRLASCAFARETSVMAVMAS